MWKEITDPNKEPYIDGIVREKALGMFGRGDKLIRFPVGSAEWVILHELNHALMDRLARNTGQTIAERITKRNFVLRKLGVGKHLEAEDIAYAAEEVIVTRAALARKDVIRLSRDETLSAQEYAEHWQKELLDLYKDKSAKEKGNLLKNLNLLVDELAQEVGK